jgi:hypothetical protein
LILIFFHPTRWGQGVGFLLINDGQPT